ncbi:lymphoid-restricted membrane protein [Willisornis vidua]|uniref:Lymphoid-restricted membrane protein n=1 Tax=Willisornis vidua TaxID=1566151 RepID=A0ABQ9DCJ2_9PASS|nr:lymphoid-restricted membrane protein [Willisornis vidua]
MSFRHRQGAKKRHHNPVDSICRKIKSIQMMDQVSNPALQIPKFQSGNFESPQCNIKKNLEEILKGRTFLIPGSASPNVFSPNSDSVFSDSMLPFLGSVSHTAYSTFTVSKSTEGSSSSRMVECPMENCSPPCFGSQEGDTQNRQSAVSNVESKAMHHKQKYVTSPPDFYFFTSDKGTSSAVTQPPGPKKFPLNERGERQTLEPKADIHNVSLISEEDLLTTIFWACDIERTGKVAVSKIMDYLRHTTSRGSEDSGLEELCYMLDPEQKDISMDLETYHAVMGEWIEDWFVSNPMSPWFSFRDGDAPEESSASMEDLELQAAKNISEAKKAHVRMNVTAGSFEAVGGDVSKGDMEVSDLITCVADLQYNHQRLQEENNKLRLMLEAVDETNNKLLADNEHLRQQVKSIQHFVLKAKSLEEELEEVRNNLNQSEERREQVLWQNKQLIQVHVYESTVGNQEASLTKKEQDIKELKLTIVECSSIIETLRAEKKQLLENMRHMQQELISNGLCFPLLCKYSSNIPEGMTSLHCELELAQSSEIIKTEWTSLDKALDREVLLLLQEPEYGGEKFKTIMQNLQEEASEVEELVLTSLEWVKNPDEDMQQAWETKLVLLKQELREKRHAWIQKLQLLEKCKETLEKDFVQMAGNLRRTRTDQLHLRKELSARQHEIETVKQLQEESAGQAEALGLELEEAKKQLEEAKKQLEEAKKQLEEAKKQLEDAIRHAEDQVEAFHSVCEEAASSRSKLEEAISEQQKLRDGIAALTSTCQLLQRKVEQEKNALTLETSCPKNPPGHSWDQPGRQSSGSCTLARGELGHVADVTSEEHKWKICSAGDSSDADLPVSITVMDSSLTELDPGESTLPASLRPSSDLFTSAQEAVTSSVDSTAPVTGCLVMEEKSPKGSGEREEDVPSSAAREKSRAQDAAGAGTVYEKLGWIERCEDGDILKDYSYHIWCCFLHLKAIKASQNWRPIKREFCPVMGEHKPAFQSVLKPDSEVDQEKQNTKEQSEEAPAVVPSRKGSSPTAGGIKGDKTKQNELESPSEKEVEAEFLRLSLGFKCDLFTLDKRVRLEERSRDLAEENLRKEITNAVKMLEVDVGQGWWGGGALVPLCEEDNQAQEIIKKLQKSLQFLSQYAARVASRAEMLGAINQESRVSKAVEVMIQHVENLKRMYAKEHAELEELKQVLLQNERSFSSLGDRDESMNKKLPSPFNFKAQLHDPDGDERSERFNRRSSSWGKLGAKQNEKRPSLQRFLSTYSWAEYEEEHLAAKNEQAEPPTEVQEQPTRKESVSEKGKCSSKWTLESVYNSVSSWASHFKASFSNTNKTFWVSVSILVLLAALTSFLTGLSLQRPAAAAPLGPGDSWTSLQQLLWPYTRLQHNGPPPI